MTLATVFFILCLVAVLGVAGVLVTGLVVMSRGGEINRKYGNRLMQARVVLQGAAIVFFILAVIAG